MSGDRTGWELTYLEIANVHGYSRGIFGFSIVPRDLREVRLFPLWLSIPIVVGLLALRPRPDWPPRPGLRRLYHLGVGLVLALFALVLLTDRFSPYKLLALVQRVCRLHCDSVRGTDISTAAVATPGCALELGSAARSSWQSIRLASCGRGIERKRIRPPPPPRCLGFHRLLLE